MENKKKRSEIYKKLRKFAEKIEKGKDTRAPPSTFYQFSSSNFNTFERPARPKNSCTSSPLGTLPPILSLLLAHFGCVFGAKNHPPNPGKHRQGWQLFRSLAGLAPQDGPTDAKSGIKTLQMAPKVASSHLEGRQNCHRDTSNDTKSVTESHEMCKNDATNAAKTT